MERFGGGSLLATKCSTNSLFQFIPLHVVLLIGKAGKICQYFEEGSIELYLLLNTYK